MQRGVEDDLSDAEAKHLAALKHFEGALDGISRRQHSFGSFFNRFFVANYTYAVMLQPVNGLDSLAALRGHQNANNVHTSVRRKR